MTTSLRPEPQMLSRPTSYRGELSRQDRLLANRRAAHEAALAQYQLQGEFTQVRRIQREIRLGEYDQRTLQRLLDAN